LRCCRKTLCVLIAVIASSCSAFGQSALERLEPSLPKLSGKALRDAVEKALPEDDVLLDEIDELDDAQLRKVVQARIDAIRIAKCLDRSISERARKIKSDSSLYRDTGAMAGSNWLAKAFEALARLFKRSRPRDLPNINAPSVGGLGQILVYMVWLVLGILLGAFLYFAIRHFSWRRQLRIKARSVLGDDEPDYSLDEWLEQADLLEAQGKYREAVRALYLACLLRFDDARIARFVRGETNWEHLKRIEASRLKPEGLEFREPTRTFDRIWYGMDVRGKDDVDLFRNWYRAVTAATHGGTS
jgi:hypothetical protein